MSQHNAMERAEPGGAEPRAAPRAIVAEDDTDCRFGLALLLRDLGYEVTMARDGAEALAWFRSFGHVALLVTDLAMPRIDGLALTRRLRALDPDLPVVAVTGAGVSLARDFEALTGRHVTLLPKPFDRAELRRAVERVAGD